MAYNLPESVIETVLNSVDIVDVISGYLELKKSGANYKALCPFHREKTASFTVSPQKQMFYCFGCQTGGNVFSFLMKYEKTTFPEAVKTLAEKAGIQVSAGWRGEETKSLHLYKVNDAASELFRGCLLSEGAGERARNYLKTRKIGVDAAEQFSLGYAVGGEENAKQLLNKNFTREQLEEAGLLVKGTSRLLFARRLVFPICNIRGKIIGFGARTLDKAEPKYINSPETGIYNKGENLYGLNFAKPHISQEGKAIVVEGYFDLIRTVQSGIKNVVASLGTALTSQQIHLLRRYTKEVILVYDGDPSGVNAALRTLDMFLESGLTVKIAPLPEKDDPDSFLLREGRSRFVKMLNDSQDLLSFKLGLLSTRYDTRTVDGRVKIVDETLPHISRISNAVERSEYVKILAERLSIDEEALIGELKKIRKRKGDERFPSLEIQSLTPLVAERTLLQLLLENGGKFAELNSKIALDDFSQPECREIAKIALEIGSMEPKKVMSMAQDEKLNKFLAQLMVNPAPSTNRGRDIEDCIRKIKKQKLKRKRAEIQKQIAEKERAGDEKAVRRLIQQFQNLLRNGSD